MLDFVSSWCLLYVCMSHVILLTSRAWAPTVCVEYLQEHQFLTGIWASAESFDLPGSVLQCRHQAGLWGRKLGERPICFPSTLTWVGRRRVFSWFFLLYNPAWVTTIPYSEFYNKREGGGLTNQPLFWEVGESVEVWGQDYPEISQPGSHVTINGVWFKSWKSKEFPLTFLFASFMKVM